MPLTLHSSTSSCPAILRCTRPTTSASSCRTSWRSCLESSGPSVRRAIPRSIADTPSSRRPRGSRPCSWTDADSWRPITGPSIVAKSSERRWPPLQNLYVYDRCFERHRCTHALRELNSAGACCRRGRRSRPLAKGSRASAVRPSHQSAARPSRSQCPSLVARHFAVVRRTEPGRCRTHCPCRRTRAAEGLAGRDRRSAAVHGRRNSVVGRGCRSSVPVHGRRAPVRGR